MPFRQKIFKHRILLLHISFWVLYLSYRIYTMYFYTGLEKALIYAMLPMTFNLITSYSHYFFILPILFQNKKWRKYFFWLVLLLVLVVTIRTFTENKIFNLINSSEHYETIRFTRIIGIAWDTLSFLVFTSMIRFVFDWFELEGKKKQLENEKLVAELNYLKSQINPHFLFNTLHNLNSLVYAGAKNANEVIIKLSNIMRYMIYESGKERVSLTSEIDYVNDYIHLEGIRLNNSFKLDFKIEGLTDNKKIAPLLLITFLENAFKHGISDQEEGCWIDVNLVVTENQLHYRVVNKKIKNVLQAKLKSGFGLDNVKKRLDLSYPEHHTLKVNELNDVYEVDLIIQFA